MSSFEEFKNFCLKYKGAILGGLIAIIFVCTGILEVIIALLIILLGAVIGNYVHRNKRMVGEKLKEWIDKICN